MQASCVCSELNSVSKHISKVLEDANVSDFLDEVEKYLVMKDQRVLVQP